jgi:hypothetical protein
MTPLDFWDSAASSRPRTTNAIPPIRCVHTPARKRGSSAKRHGLADWIPAFAQGCPGNENRLFYLYRNQQKVVMRALGLRERRTIGIKPEDDPRIHALVVAASAWGDDMDAHGTSPWGEGPRIKSGHDDFELCNDRCMLRSARIANFPGQPCAFAGMTRSAESPVWF